MRILGFVGLAAVAALLVAPWLMATFDCAAYSQDFLGAVHPATGSQPQAQSIAELADDIAAKHGLVSHVRVTVSDPRIHDASKPDGPDNRIQDVRVEIELEKKLLVVGTKRNRTTYDFAMGGKGTANAWPLPE